MKHEEFRFDYQNTDFFGQYWESNNTKSVIVLVHGMGSHSSRYANFVVPKLIENNYSVVAFDHFGHGKTKGKRGYCPSVEAVLGSVSAIIEKARNLFPNKPIFLYGHSMGGNVVVNYALRKNDDLKGVIATSPFLKLAFNPPVWKMKMGKFLRNICPKMTLNGGLDETKISRIPEEVQNYKNDKMVHGDVGLVFALDFIETGKWAIENAEKLQIPMFLAHGTDDGLTSFEASKEFSEKSKLVTFKGYENAYHELHNDLCRDEFINDVLNWLENQKC